MTREAITINSSTGVTKAQKIETLRANIRQGKHREHLSLRSANRDLRPASSTKTTAVAAMQQLRSSGRSSLTFRRSRPGRLQSGRCRRPSRSEPPSPTDRDLHRKVKSLASSAASCPLVAVIKRRCSRKKKSSSIAIACSNCSAASLTNRTLWTRSAHRTCWSSLMSRLSRASRRNDPPLTPFICLPISSSSS